MSLSSAFPGDLYVGVTGLRLPDEPLDLGEGVSLRRTQARFSTSFMLHNTEQREFDIKNIRPAYWQVGGTTNDVEAELHISSASFTTFDERYAVARTIVFLIRLFSNPGITMHVLSDNPLSTLTELGDSERPHILPIETFPRHFQLTVADESKVQPTLVWVKDNWTTAHKLYADHPEFRVAADAIDSGQFIPNAALTLVLLWGALEAIFSPSTSELRFRVSALIASYLEPSGEQRVECQKKVAALYDKRSAAAHGKPRHEADDLFETYQLLRRVVIKIINTRKVPTKDELNGYLFGC
jgi:hypothetical protein